VGVEAPERREFRKEEAAMEMQVLKEKGGQRIKRRRRRGSETLRCQVPNRFMAKEIHQVSRLSAMATDSEESKSTLPR
jgi:putative hemolysin